MKFKDFISGDDTLNVIQDILKQNNYTFIVKKNKITAVISFFIPLLILGCTIMWYNNARFGSPFQFGAIYN